MGTYTTVAIVRATVKEIDAGLLDSSIELYISEAEGILDALMGQSFVDTFQVSKHGILRASATKWAGLCALTYSTNGFISTQSASMTADILWEEWRYLTELLSLDKVVRGLE